MRWLWLLIFLCCNAASAEEGIRRCVDANGVTVYTDRSCAALEATEQLRPGIVASEDGAMVYQPAMSGGCARDPESLLDGVRGAVDAQDVNRLASYYHWVGISNTGAAHLMDRLSKVAAQPTLSVELLYPIPDPDLPLPPWQPEFDADGNAIEPEPPQPTSLRIYQLRSQYDEDSGSATTFELRRHANCWWISY